MNLDELKPKQASKDYSNKLQAFCGVKVDINKLNLDQSQRLLLTVNEQVERGKQVSESRHTSHRNKSFTSLLLLRKVLESKILELTRNKNVKPTYLREGEENKASLLLATKDIIDRVQGMVDDISKTRNQDLPPLLDRIREEMGSDVSDNYSEIAGPALDSLLANAVSSRDIVGKASGILTGDYKVDTMGDADPVGAPVEGDELGGNEEISDFEDVQSDDFDVADGAVGGEEEIGRQERI